jgi:single-strand DNA-binding protein
MASGGVNKVILIGNLGADPELRYTSGGQAVCDLRLATNESWKDKEGQKQERVEWHRVVFWGKAAEILKQYATKGGKLYVEGRLQTRSWDDKEGQKRYSTEIVGSEFQFLGGKGEGGSQDRGRDSDRDRGRSNDGPPQGDGPPYNAPGPDDDIPF